MRIVVEVLHHRAKAKPWVIGLRRKDAGFNIACIAAFSKAKPYKLLSGRSGRFQFAVVLAWWLRLLYNIGSF
jgi:hypothetical protein